MMPSLDELLSRRRLAEDFASTLVRSVLKNRMPASKPTGVAALNRVGGASRRGSAVHPTTAKTANTLAQRANRILQHQETPMRAVFMFRYLRIDDSMPDRCGINRASRLGRERDRHGCDDEDGGDHHHQAVGGQHQAFARDKVVEHLANHLSV